MKTVELKAQVRKDVGKNAVKKIRTQGVIPAVVYGFHIKPISIQVDLKEFKAVIHTQAGENVLINLNLEGEAKKDQKTVLIKEIQHNPVSDQITHVDFNAISLTEKIKTKVAVHEKGLAPGLKEGGIMDHVHREVEVECLPTSIPDHIEINVENLKINDAVHVKDLVLPEGVVCLLDPDEVILKVLPPAREEVAAEAIPGEAAAQPEVITAKKPVEGEAAPAEGGKAAPKKEQAKPSEKK